MLRLPCEMKECALEESPFVAEPAESVPVDTPVRIQILATEHWSLLAQRSMIWSELFNRTAMFITVLSASVVALALVADATDFNEEFHVFALLVLPMTLVLGVGTLIRLGHVMTEDVWLIMGMNRIRRGYMDTAPELDRYFVAGVHDDIKGVLVTRGPQPFNGPSHLLSAAPTVVAIVNAALFGVIAGLFASYLGTSERVENTIGIVAFAVAVVLLLTFIPRRSVDRVSQQFTPRFPTPADGTGHRPTGT